MLTKAIARIKERKARKERELIRREAAIGATLFGPVPAGHTRSFFCLDADTWVWDERWVEDGLPKHLHTRYDIINGDIVKTQNGVRSRLTEEELVNLHTATTMYKDRVGSELYNHAPYLS